MKHSIIGLVFIFLSLISKAYGGDASDVIEIMITGILVMVGTHFDSVENNMKKVGKK